jgi:hypothetical protein
VAQDERIDDVIGNAELRLEIPIVRGFKIPLAFNYASRTETSTSSDFRVNLGVNFDSTTLQALSRFAGFTKN